MTKKNLLVVPECEQMLQHYREEIAMEFGIHRSVQEMDAVSRSMTRKIMDETNKNNNTEECE
ncbi:small, acid-soluble spore protein, alpha/beta type [Alkalihalobacterium elongatum]|uniref:small, acid-soluble spore protein, alpha/beta type n=1 Tax=Alkalihalobacterium elongatum TaxID=2675466 RepID=UPI001C1F4679|nr:small, acid-soluble spore protein, alpha/beta type [Alkalihalobacterium elongatum]